MQIELTKHQKTQKINWVKNYMASSNAADGSTLDANANVSHKNLATMQAEINKDINIQINREMVTQKIERLFGKRTAKAYLRDLEDHLIYAHDETSLLPYCASISMYPFLVDGMKPLGGESSAPKHLESFCGSFVNLIFAVASQFAGAVATVEFLTYFNYFATRDLGKDYLVTNKADIENLLQMVVYSANQPAAARGYQSIFWNISIFDKEYFNGIFGDFVFPDTECTTADWEGVDKLQRFFMKWFNKEREKEVLTFPVVTASLLGENGQAKDEEFASFIAEELSDGNSFFVYTSENVDSLASCCRLRNELTDNVFSTSSGAGGIATGSINVITLNYNRLLQEGKCLKSTIERIHKYQVAYRSITQDYQDAGMLPVYSGNFISLDKQFLTIGINGMVEAAEYSGIAPKNTTDYKEFVSKTLKVIFDTNKEGHEKYGFRFNTEFVPAENLGVKNAKWDKQDGYASPRPCYNSYFYAVEDDDISIVDKFVLHGEDIVKYLDGGSALHLNLGEYPTKEAYLKLINLSITVGCNYWTTNVKVTICNECENIDKRTLDSCPECGSKNIDYCTRVIGYLKRISNFSGARQNEQKIRNYHKK